MAEPFVWLKGWKHEPQVDRPVRVLGIDLGTTNSTVTEIVWDPTSYGRPVSRVLEIRQPTLTGELVQDLVPSVVAITPDGGEMVGAGAHRLRASNTVQVRRNHSIWWETKDEIGTRRVYQAAPEGYRYPRDIAARILRFLHEAALDEDPQPIDRVVITVPASFGLTQRSDTELAARAAGLEVLPGDLFDEPVAAFLDYLNETDGAFLQGNDTSRVLVLDFGGGTADVALIQVTKADGGLQLARKGVSRFHQIGGADIDDVIAAEVLYPQLLDENAIPPFALTFKNKRDFVFPALSTIAESLKKNLSAEVARRVKLGIFDENDPLLSAGLPTVYRFATGHPDYPEVTLTRPRLSLQQSQKATSRFLSRVPLPPVEEEYVSVHSIFAPVRDCLAGAQWTPHHIDAVLLVGGSSLFWDVPQQVASYFPDAAVLTYKNALDAQRCVGRGAAYHALMLAVYGSSPLTPTLADGICIRTTDGPHEIIKRGAALPFPALAGPGDSWSETWESVETLALSSGSSVAETPLQIQLLSGDAPLLSEEVSVKPPSEAGNPIEVRIHLDANQVLEAEIRVTTASQIQTFGPIRIENPFSVVSNPNSKRDRILEIEEQLPHEPVKKQRTLLTEMAQLHLELRERERARQLYEGLLESAPPVEQAGLLTKLAAICGGMHDRDSQVAHYKMAAQLGSGPALFNLALAMNHDKFHQEALEVADRNLANGQARGENHALRGWILSSLGRTEDARASYAQAVQLLDNYEERSKFELAWLRMAASGLGLSDLVAEVDALRTRRTPAENSAAQDGEAGLPDWTP